MNNDIDNKVADCRACIEKSRLQSDDPKRQDRLDIKEPMYLVGMDHGSWKNQTYLVMVDAFSSYIFVCKVKNTGSDEAITHLEAWFLDVGYPRFLLSDGATGFTSTKFNDYCKSKNINNDTSSAEFPQSNGLAENGIGRAKTLIKKCQVTGESPTEAISAYRCLPLTASGVSPHELFFKRTPRSHLPHLDIAYDEEKATAARRKESAKYRKPRTAANQHQQNISKKPRDSLERNDKVWVYNRDCKIWNLPGVILSQRDTGRSYWVRIVTTGAELLRNRKFLKPRRHLVTADSAHLDKEQNESPLESPLSTTRDCQSDVVEPPQQKDVNVLPPTGAPPHPPVLRRSSRLQSKVQRTKCIGLTVKSRQQE